MSFLTAQHETRSFGISELDAARFQCRGKAALSKSWEHEACNCDSFPYEHALGYSSKCIGRRRSVIRAPEMEAA